MQRILDAQSLAQLWRGIRRYYFEHGFNAVAYFIPKEPGISRSHAMNVVHHGWPKHLVETYIEHWTDNCDPVPRFAMEHGQAIGWLEAWEHIVGTDEQLVMRMALREAGIGRGYAVPVFGPGGRNATLQVGMPVSDEAYEAAPLKAFQITAQAAHLRLCEMMPGLPMAENPLSGREMEILHWVARGKSNTVIADILDLSSATVDTYLRRIYDKLDVSDRTSAAVKGVGLGLIAA